MATKRIAERLETGMKNHNPGIEEMMKCLRDVSDDQVSDAVFKYRPSSFDELTVYLEEETEDKEIKAHLRGFDSYKHRLEEIRKTNELIERVYERSSDQRKTW